MRSSAGSWRAVPFPDEHPCLDRDGYGFSKYLMEEVTKYYHHQNNGIDVINPRLSSVAPDENMPPLRRVTTLSQWLRVKGLNVTHPVHELRSFWFSSKVKLDGLLAAQQQDGQTCARQS